MKVFALSHGYLMLLGMLLPNRLDRRSAIKHETDSPRFIAGLFHLQAHAFVASTKILAISLLLFALALKPLSDSPSSGRPATYSRHACVPQANSFVDSRLWVLEIKQRQGPH